MKPALLDILRCPRCHGALTLLGEPGDDTGEVEKGELSCHGCDDRYPIVDYIPRFVGGDNYADSFSLEWSRFRTTQLDSSTGVAISRDRFFAETRWKPDDLRGSLVLDVGCGSGRFVEVALAAGAHVVALDYSGAVDACRLNFGAHPNLDIVQGDICHLPFRSGAFDFVYCLGVLQHTPDVRRSFLSLPEVLRPGGHLAVDAYPKKRFRALWPKYLLRRVTRFLSPGRLFRVVQVATGPLLALSNVIDRIPVHGRRLRHVVPVANYRGVYPLDEARLREFAVLDTFDMFSPAYDQPQTAATLRSWFHEAGLADVEVAEEGLVVGRATKP